MADTYREDDSIAPEHAAAKIGEKISWGARAIDGIGSISGMAFLPSLLMNGTIPNMFGSNPDMVATLVDSGLGAQTAQKTAETLGSVGITDFSPVLAGLAAAGEGLKVIDDLASGNMKKAGKHMVVGASKAGVVFLDGLTMGIAEIPSLLFTGKFLSTNVGDIVGQMLDSADTNAPTASNLAGVGFTDPRYAMPSPPPTDTRQVVQDNAPPYGMQAPEGGWRNYVMARRSQGVVQQPGEEAPQPVVSGNPRFASAVEVARNAAASGPQQLNS